MVRFGFCNGFFFLEGPHGVALRATARHTAVAARDDFEHGVVFASPDESEVSFLKSRNTDFPVTGSGNVSMTRRIPLIVAFEKATFEGPCVMEIITLLRGLRFLPSRRHFSPEWTDTEILCIKL